MFSMVECYLEMGQIGQDYGLKQYLMDKIELDHVTQVIGYHPSYLEHFLKTQNFVMRGDGPLPYHYRHYLAIMAAARHQCTYLINLHEQEFIRQGGDQTWLNGLEFIPAKLRAIYDINKLLAHRPWLLSKDHIERLTKGKHSWSMAEVVHAIVLLAHFHSLSSFVFSCGLTQELDITTTCGGGDNDIPIIISQQGTTQSAIPITTESSQIFNSNIPQHITKTICDVNDDEEEEDTSSENEEVSVDDLMARMKVLSEKPNECNEVELSNRFKNVEQQAASLPAAVVEQPVFVPQTISHYVDDPDFTYQDFARRGAETMTTTFRIQDYSWDDHGYSLVNRLYNDVGTLLDVKFRAAYNLTYFTMAGRKNVDTSKFRRAIWNYIQCIYGIRHDDYDYGEVNQLLDKSLKMFIKTACCFPERITKQDYDSILCELLHSEKVHVNLMILEARNQAELLYALREIMRYMT